MDFMIGERVKVINDGNLYSTYKDFFCEHNLCADDWKSGRDLDEAACGDFTLLYVGKHCDGYADVCLIQDADRKTFLVGAKGLESINNKKIEVVVEDDTFLISQKDIKAVKEFLGELKVK